MTTTLEIEIPCGSASPLNTESNPTLQTRCGREFPNLENVDVLIGYDDQPLIGYDNQPLIAYG